MYKLRTIADSHPLNRFRDVLDFTFQNPHYKMGIARDFIEDIARNPSIVTKSRFWKSVMDKMKEYWLAEKFDLSHPTYVKRELPQYRAIERTFEVMRRTYQAQFEIIDQGDFKDVYCEGKGTHPFKRYIHRHHVLTRFTDLDSHTYTREEITPKLQKKREQIWLCHLNPSPKINKSLLSAGHLHVVEDLYGCVKELYKKGIELDIVKNCSIIIKEVPSNFTFN
jgi:hypothetical protein